MSVSSRNATVVIDNPSVIEELIFCAPSTPATASSIVLVTCASSSAGAAPTETITDTTGTSAFGMRVIGSLLKLRYPSATTASAMTSGGSGCRIDHAEMFTAIRSRSGLDRQ